MHKITMKKGWCILCYLIVILSFFWFCMGKVQKMSNRIEVSDYIVQRQQMDIPGDATDYDDTLMEEDPLLQELEQYQSYYNQEFQKQLVPLILQFSLVFISSSLLFWYVMRKLEKQDRLRIAQDLTTLKQYQELPQADPILKQAYETIQKSYEQHFEDYKRLHAYLSHEQKNALALLQSNLELKDYERCLANTAALAQGIEDLLTISDSGGEEQYVPVDVIMVCADICDAYRKKGNIQFDFEEEQDCTILAKKRWIYRAIANLVDNAIKYGEGKPIKVSVTKEKQTVLVSVQDHGIGISEAQQALMFQHGYRIQELQKDGYGIGLSLVAHVMELVHGTIQVTSALKKGTTIQLRFPSL